MDETEDKIIKAHTPTVLTDEEAITTSTDSNLFDSWTLVTDRQLKKTTETNQNATQSKPRDCSKEFEVDQNRVEDLAPTKDVAEPEKETHNDSKSDDLSDGISIISESEKDGNSSSTEEHLTTHPSLQAYLNNLHINSGVGYDDLQELVKNELCDAPIETATSSKSVVDANVKQVHIRQRYRKHSKATSSSNDKQKQLINSFSVAMCLPSNALFYLKIGLAMIFLLLLGKQLPSGVFVGEDRKLSTEQLERKVSDMELQNNLLRAEIDILSKQVNYLSNQKQQQQTVDEVQAQNGYQHQQTNSRRKEKTFKAWSGNGDSLQPKEISKANLKQPYKCADERFVHVAGMCVEKSTVDVDPASLLDEFGNAIGNDVFQSAETFKNFEKVLEQLQAFNSEEQPKESQQQGETKNKFKRQINIDESDYKEDNDQIHNHFNERTKESWHVYEQPHRRSAEVVREYHNKKYKKRYSSKNDKADESNESDEDANSDDNQSNNFQQQNFQKSNEDTWAKQQQYRNSKESFKERSNEYFTEFGNEPQKSREYFKENINKDKSQEHFVKQNKLRVKDRSAVYSKERFEDHSEENSKEQFRQHSGDTSKERFKDYSRENSKERFRDHSKKRFGERANSKEQYNDQKKQQRSQEHNSKEHQNKRKDSNDVGSEWHAKLMQQRANARLQNEKPQRLNWFIQRGKGRGEMRV